MPNSITQAQPPLEFIPPAYNPIVNRVAKLVLPSWTRWRVHLSDIQVNRAEILVDLYQQFQAGKIRFIMAFRHASVNDPFCMYHLVSRAIPKAARQQGVALKQPVHAYFMYDRGIPLWAGRWVGWFLSQMGGTPIRRGKLDLQGLRSARELFVNGQFPLAAAPEGATNGHNEVVSPIEPGVAQLSFWCVEDLQKADRNEQVLIVPIGIQYYYITQDWRRLEELLSQLESDAGLSPYKPDCNGRDEDVPLDNQTQLQLYQRLIRLSEFLLSRMEEFYSKFYHYNRDRWKDTPASTLDPALNPALPSSQLPDSLAVNQQLAQRLHALMHKALMVAEDYFNLQPKGSFTDRCRRLEQAGWDWIYREDLKHLETLPPVERGLADRIAEEADLRLWHMRLVESFVSVTGYYVIEKPSFERFAETLLLLWEMVTRIKGKPSFQRPSLGTQSVQITISPPLSVSDRWDAYKANRRQAVAQLTQELQQALEKMILS
jgi:1-acyl-sn-glycerol-3-phosphate acyltransferase